MVDDELQSSPNASMLIQPGAMSGVLVCARSSAERVGVYDDTT
jgi:hypothetical protein